MTSYPAWRRHQIRSNWKNLVSIFLTVTLLFALVNGFSKGISIKDKIGRSNWDGKSPIVIAVNSLNPTALIYQPDQKKLTSLAISSETYVESDGSSSSKLSKLSNFLNDDSKFVKLLSLTFGTKVENYVDLGDKNGFDENQNIKVFKNFASITTPFKIITSGYKDIIMSTNITRIDAFRLWWEIKGLGVNDVHFRDLSNLSEEIIDEKSQKVLGADSDSLNKEISQYLQDLDFLNENLRITIINQSGTLQASKIANSFVKSVGMNVVDVKNEESLVGKTQIYSDQKGSATVRYLEKIFNCDINDQRESSQNVEIVIVLGQDFAQFWLE